MSGIREHLRIALAITRKDIADALTNRMFLVGFLLPPLLSALFSIIYVKEFTNQSLNISVYDPENSAMVEAIRSMDGVTLIDASSADQVARDVEDDAVAGIIVPAGFDTAMQAGDQPELTLLVDQGEGIGTENSVNRIVQEALRQAAGQSLPAQIAVTHVGEAAGQFASGNLSLQHFFMMTLVILAMLTLGVNTMPNMMIEEKERHTLDAILVSPASPVDVVLGKAIVGMLFMAADVAILLGINNGLAGQWPLTLLLIFLGCIMMVLMGLLIGTAFQRQVTANMWGTVVVMILIIPTWFVSGGPDIIRTLVRALPTYYIVDGIQQTLAGAATFESLSLDLAVLLAVSVALFGMVVWAQARQEV
jgi:ABC-2 type transport system permease protein